MTLPNRLRDHKTMMSIGMACLAIGLTLPMFLHPAAGFGTNLLHGVRGFLLGLSIVMNLWAARVANRQRRCSES